MRPLVWVTILFAGAAIALVWVEAGWRPLAWAGLAAIYGTLCVWGVVSPGSGLLGPVVVRGDPSQPWVALTFDDGPDPAATPALLDLLAERGLAATFFCVGERARGQPDLVRRLHDAGHLLANHSDRHSLWTNFYPAFLLRPELEACQETLRSLTDVAARYYRPPMGLMNHAVTPVARALGLTVVGWQVRGLDTGARSPKQVVDRILDRVEPGGIVLLHDGGQDPERLVTIVEGVLDGLAQRGLTAVRLDRLLSE